jgi:uncharacterized protein (DUF305 family)
MKSKWTMFALLMLSLVGLSTTTTMAAPAADRGARAEVRFLEGMIDHHQMAVDMADDCLKKAKTDSVLTLCKNIITVQSAEIKLMEGWLASWYQLRYNPMPMSQMMDMMNKSQSGMMMGDMQMSGGMQMSGTPDMNGMNMGGTMNKMPDDMPGVMGMMAGLSKLEGNDYEIAWVEAMIDHHSMAIAMAQQLLPHVEHPELKKQAQSIIDDQSAEIKQMEGLLTQAGEK